MDVGIVKQLIYLIYLDAFMAVDKPLMALVKVKVRIDAVRMELVRSEHMKPYGNKQQQISPIFPRNLSTFPIQYSTQKKIWEKTKLD